MVDTNTSISVIAFTVNRLRWDKIDTDITCIMLTLYYGSKERLKVKWWKKCSNCKKTGVAISVSQKVDFKPRYANWIKEGIFMIIMRLHPY